MFIVNLIREKVHIFQFRQWQIDRYNIDSQQMSRSHFVGRWPLTPPVFLIKYRTSLGGGEIYTWRVPPLGSIDSNIGCCVENTQINR